MSENKNNSYIGIAAGIGLIILLSFVANLIISIIVGMVAGAIVHFMVNKDKGQTETAAATAETKDVDAVDAAIESLLDSNLALRKTIIPQDLRQAFEDTIDKLIALLPEVNAKSKDNELTWVINRIATEYLPEKSLKPYLALDDTSRNDEETIASVMDGLNSMKSELLEVESMLSDRKMNEFNAKAKFLKQRFNI